MRIRCPEHGERVRRTKGAFRIGCGGTLAAFAVLYLCGRVISHLLSPARIMQQPELLVGEAIVALVPFAVGALLVIDGRARESWECTVCGRKLRVRLNVRCAKCNLGPLYAEEARCPRCNEPVPQSALPPVDARFCAGCGSAFADPNQRFCGTCGRPRG